MNKNTRTYIKKVSAKEYMIVNDNDGNETEELSWEEQQERSDRACKERVKDIIDRLFSELNRMGNEEKVGEYVVEAIRQNHRTLQQNFVGHIIIPSIKDFAKRHDEGQFDGRNEASCKLAKKIEPLIKEAYLPFA